MDSIFKMLMKEGRCFLNEPLSKHTTFGVGGNATIFVLPKTIEQLVEIVGFCEDNGMHHMIIGNGSNLLFSDDGFLGVVVCTSKMEQSVFARGNSITASAGVSFSKVAVEAQKMGLSGIEWSIGIPGTIGGAVVQNAGAFGGNIGNVVSKVLCYHSRKLETIPANECYFSYRSSRFKTENHLILDACFVLKKDDPELIKNRMKLFATKRAATQPFGKSAGSVFKSVNGIAAGYLIEKAGLKGEKCGGAEVSQKHANFILNNGNATAKDIVNLIDEIREKVHNMFGIVLETEIEFVEKE